MIMRNAPFIPTGMRTLQAFDGGLQHKWLDFGGANGGVTWLEYRLLPAQPAVAVTRYSLTAAEDEPNRDPCDFVLEGSIECPAASGRNTSFHTSELNELRLMPALGVLKNIGSVGYLCHWILALEAEHRAPRHVCPYCGTFSLQ